MNNLLLELIRPSAIAIPPSSVERLTRQTDWRAFCSLAHRTSLAPLAYDRLRRHPAFVPEDILDWLRTQYYETVGRNLLQLNNAHEVTAKLSAGGIPVLVLKGLVLAHFGLGLRVRRFSDLDLLVRRHDVEAAATILRSLGYFEVPGPPHGFHQGYIRVNHGPPAGIEVHFDLIDRYDSTIRPDVASVWDRSLEFNILGHSVRAPELSDHLLLAMIQLANHSWPPRLLADIAALASRWSQVIDWESLVARAEAWRMRALMGSTLHIMTSMLQVHLPASVRSYVEPESYLRRVQWHIARQAATEHLSYRPSAKIFRIASVFMVDQLSAVTRLSTRRTFFATGNYGPSRIFSGPVQRFVAGVSSLPRLLRILFKGMIPMSFD